MARVKGSASSWSLLQEIEKDLLKVSPGIYLEGEDPYICRVLEDEFKAQGFEVVKEDLSASGPSPEWEAHASSMGLFADKKVIWSTFSSNPKKWSAAGIYRFENLQKNLEAGTLLLVLQCTNNKLKVDPGEYDLTSYSLSYTENEKAHWLKRMSEKDQAPLNKASAQFLLSFDFDLLSLSQYVKLWALGGDFWAERALGWNPEEKHISNKSLSNTPPAFRWVDAVIEGRKNEALKLLKSLHEEGQELIQLFALLAKTLRILSILQNNMSTEGQTPFLIQKLRRQRIAIDVNSALLEWVKADYAFKSSAQDNYAIAERFISAI